jgi:glycosyltransferase involved in cell wall biosynthesis
MPKHQNIQILVIADLSPPIQGISIVTEWVLNQLAALNFRLYVINTTVNTKYFYKLRRTHKFLETFFTLMRSKSYNILYIPLSHGESLLFQSLFVLIGKLQKKTTIVHHHSYLPINSSSNFLHRISHGMILQNAEHIFLSEKMKNDYFEVWGRTDAKYWVISNHDVAKSRINSDFEYSQENSSVNFIHFGNLSQEKGFHEVVEACEPYLRCNPNYHFRILGGTRENKIMNSIQRLKKKYPNQFTHSDLYTADQLSRNLTESDILLFPSQYKNEASPLVILEAQSLGVLVAATDIGTINTEVLQPGFSVKVSNFQDELRVLVTNLLDIDNRNILRRTLMDEMMRLSLKAQIQVREVFEK